MNIGAKTAESFFSKLKLIESFFGSLMSQQEKRSGLALLSTENERSSSKFKF